jgi:hypothetical protein
MQIASPGESRCSREDFVGSVIASMEPRHRAVREGREDDVF